ncbi:MAG: TldD/PmbA family protein [Acidimicrobiia bacterium]|nr:TldD/PmbA family protein [Acidimicrobiia bacterium]
MSAREHSTGSAKSTTTGDGSEILSSQTIEQVLGAALASGADFAEVFVEDVTRSSAYFDDGRVESLSSDSDRGVGIRVIHGDSTGFAHTSNLSDGGLLRAARAAAAATGGGGGTGSNRGHRVASTILAGSTVETHPEEVAKTVKVELLSRANEAARATGDAISQVSARYGDSRRRIQVANSDGVFAGSDQTRTLFSVSCVASGDTGMQTGSETIGHTIGFELFDRYDVEALARTAADRALTKLTARPAPSGTMPVVIGPGSGGVLFHEACGHGLEADLVRKGASAFAGRIGEQVASPLVTLIDDGTMTDEWGHLRIDDEGHPAARNVLIQDGILVDYMWDGLRARSEGRRSSGNGRRQSYRHLPMVRMTNTFLAPGEADPEDLIAGVEKGVYVARLGGGQVNTASGDFTFGMVEAYLIEGGRITAPLREGQLIGNGPKVLTQIEAVGNDFRMGSPGTCGKDGQGVPAGMGVPTLKVAELTIGGTAG